MLKQRWDKLTRSMEAAKASGIALMPGPNMFYLTGLLMGLSERPTLLVIGEEDRACLIMPELEKQKGWVVADRLRSQGIGAEFGVYSYTDEEGPHKAFQKALRGQTGSWALEHPLRMLEYSLMKEAMGEFSWVDAGGVMKPLRMVKDEDELANMQQAARLADMGAHIASKLLAPGKRATQIALEIEWQLKQEGADRVYMSLATGPDTAIPHAGTSSRVIEPGDLAWLDLCVNVAGYWSDITRTYPVGGISDELRRIYEVVVEAQEAARTTKLACQAQT